MFASERPEAAGQDFAYGTPADEPTECRICVPRCSSRAFNGALDCQCGSGRGALRDVSRLRDRWRDNRSRGPLRAARSDGTRFANSHIHAPIPALTFADP